MDHNIEVISLEMKNTFERKIKIIIYLKIKVKLYFYPHVMLNPQFYSIYFRLRDFSPSIYKNLQFFSKLKYLSNTVVY